MASYFVEMQQHDGEWHTEYYSGSRLYKESFATLAEVQDYVRDRWQGLNCVDGPREWHTDYSKYRAVGFKLTDLGRP